MRLLWAAIFGICSVNGFAQIVDDFSDGNFTANPPWVGSIADFSVIDAEMQLDADGTGESFTALAAAWKDTLSQSFKINMDFAPSGSNKLRVFLSSDRADLTNVGEGYFLQIGESGSEDNLEFYRMDNGNDELLAEGTIAALAAGGEFRIRVTRSSSGLWTIEADFDGGNNYVEEISFVDNTYQEGKYFGFFCDYTSSRAKAFAFDDIYIDPIFEDEVAPQLESLNVLNDNELLLIFDEALDSATATQLNNYDIDFSPPISINAVSSNQVQLTFGFSFKSGESYTLRYGNIEDISGNVLRNGRSDFVYFQPQKGDILINEIYADPNPSLGLPEGEFVELYNTTSVEIDLSGWQFSDASSEVALPTIKIAPKSYLILCETDFLTAYSVFGEAVDVNLPALNNGGDDLTLLTPSGRVIDEVSYTNEWYGDSDKAAGGYTLELINPEVACSGQNNWTASRASIGGSPGEVNSVFSTQKDRKPPVLSQVDAVAEDTIHLFFDEALDSSSAAFANFSIEGLGSPNEVIVSEYPHRQVSLVLTNSLVRNEYFDLTVGGIKDCEGNVLDTIFEDAVIYLVPQEAEMFDLLITEIFADPTPIVALPEAEYVELYNRANYPVSLKNWVLADERDKVNLPDFILESGKYIILCSSANAFDLQFYGEVLPVSIPSLSNAGELLSLRNAEGNLIHFVEYSDEWYKDESKADGGYSLEMLDTDNPCGRSENWEASAGSPGAENERAVENEDTDVPRLERANLLSAKQMEIVYNESLDSNSLLSLNNYQVLGINNSPISAEISSKLLDRVKITWSQKFDENELFELEVNDISDCVGNALNSENTEFALPVQVDSFDLVINEVLFNPPSNGSDYIEIFNRSDKYIDISEVFVTSREANESFDEIKALSRQARLLKPQEYLLLSEDVDAVEENYFVEQKESLLEVEDLPTMPNSEGNIALVDSNKQVIDELFYDEDWHFALLDDQDGVSLERINFHEATQSSANWHSASSASGYGTPGYINSQYSDSLKTKNTVTLSSQVMSPDGDGFQDVLQIKIASESPAQSVSIRIFSLEGQLVKRLVPHEILGAQSLYSWKGETDDGRKAPIGVYIIYIEIVNLNGSSERFKKTVALVGKI